MTSRRAFTLIELLVVIAIIAILAVVVVLTLNPAQLLAESRDANRVSDMATLSSAIGLYQTDQSGASGYSMGNSNTVYPSLPDSGSASSTCGDLGLITLPSGYSYHCATSANLRLASSSGWIPVNFNNISSGSPFGSLPVDPTNSSSSRLYYTYTTNGTQFEVTAAMESSKYQVGGSSDEITGDGAPLATVYAKGTNLTLEPLDYGDPTLVGYWPLNECTGSSTRDGAGSGNNGTWSGTPIGSGGTYYTTGISGGCAGDFDGSTDAVTLTNTAGLNIISGPFTIATWIDIPAYVTSSQEAAYSDSMGYEVGGFMLGLNNVGGGIFTANQSGSFWTVSTTTPISLNQWNQLVGVYNGTSESLYLNGALIGTQSNPAPPASSSRFYIGAPDQGGWTPFKGAVDNVRLYTRALTGAQITAIYNAKN